VDEVVECLSISEFSTMPQMNLYFGEQAILGALFWFVFLGTQKMNALRRASRLERKTKLFNLINLRM